MVGYLFDGGKHVVLFEVHVGGYAEGARGVVENARYSCVDESFGYLFGILLRYGNDADGDVLLFDNLVDL